MRGFFILSPRLLLLPLPTFAKKIVFCEASFRKRECYDGTEQKF